MEATAPAIVPHTPLQGIILSLSRRGAGRTLEKRTKTADSRFFSRTSDDDDDDESRDPQQENE
jgi:hypothetical protein